MPMIPEAVVAMLACARLGAVHSVVFGGFAAASLATRIDDATPKVMVTADAGMRGGKPVPYKHLVDEALRLAKNPPAAERFLKPFDAAAHAERIARLGALPPAQR
jgi:propionyl-CoA synthetase